MQWTPVLFLTVFLLVLPTFESKPSYIECESSLECGEGRCCMLGMNRYSMPTCLPLGQINEPCKVWDNGPLNQTVSYPDGNTVKLTEIFRQFCPCAPQLSCSLNSMMCIQPEELDNEISQFP